MLRQALCLEMAPVVRSGLRCTDQTDGKNFNVLRDVGLFDKGPMVTVDMTIDFFDDGLNKLTGIGLLEGLIEVHYVPHHLSKEGNGLTHSFLQLKMQIMFPGVVSLTCRL